MNRCVLGIIMLVGGALIGVCAERHRVREAAETSVITGTVDDSQLLRLDIDDLLDAIEWVESKGDACAAGDLGEVGAYQITKQYVDDVNRILKCDAYSYEDRFDKIKSREMVLIYIEYYDIYGFSLEDKARIHNAGPDGWRNDPRWFVRNRDYTIEEVVTKINNSLAYWELVKSAMEEGK